MPNSNAPSTSDLCPITFLREHPALACSLLNDFNSLDDVRTVIEPVLNPGDRCQLTPFYIQALITRRTAFLSTNLNGQEYSQLSAINLSWLVGRHSTCAIAIPNSSVSRCHAVIGQHATDGICVTDLGSINGTWVNRHKLAPFERRKLRDGDLVQFGQVQAEFFVSGQGYHCSEDSTYS